MDGNYESSSIVDEGNDKFTTVLMIKNAAKQDEGIYECEIMNDLGTYSRKIEVFM